MSATNEGPSGQNVEVEEVCLSEAEICEQLVRMAQDTLNSVEAETAVMNMPPITAGTRVQLVDQPTVSRSSSHSGSHEMYVVEIETDDGAETVVEVPSTLFNKVVNSRPATVTDLLHSYAARETEKESDEIVVLDTTYVQQTFIDNLQQFVTVIGAQEQEVSTDSKIAVENDVIVNGEPENKDHETGTNVTDINQIEPSTNRNVSQLDYGDLSKAVSRVIGLDVKVRKDDMMDLPELSEEPVPVQKKIPYAVLRGNTLTLLQECNGKNSAPILAKTRAHEALTKSTSSRDIPLINKHRLRRRIVTEPGQMPYICDICSKGFSHAYNLKLHLRAHIDDRPHICDVCNKGFLQATKLKNHMTTHTKEKRFQCDVCKKMFGYQESLKKHARVHSGEKMFECGVCNKQFAWLNVLNCHMITHSTDKRYICDVCGKSFAYHTSLKAHLQRHCHSTTLTCEICEHVFLFEGTLHRHMHTHANEALYQCLKCDKKFASVAILERHCRIHDPHSDLFRCKLCMQTFAEWPQLNEHLQTHTEERKHVCDECGKGFVHARGLKQHEKLHTGVPSYVCPVCEKAFQHRGNLTMHLRSHTGEKPYSCVQCDKKFTGSSSLKRHARLHSGERPYVCAYCGSRFSDAARLNKHTKTTHANDSRFVVYEVQQVKS